MHGLNVPCSHTYTMELVEVFSENQILVLYAALLASCGFSPLIAVADSYIPTEQYSRRQYSSEIGVCLRSKCAQQPEISIMTDIRSSVPVCAAIRTNLRKKKKERTVAGPEHMTH